MEMVPTTTQPLCRTEFEKQFTKEMLLSLVKRTTALARRYERFLPRRSTDSAEDRIHTAITKFLDGARIWDPTRVDLCGFLLGVVASDLSNEVRHAVIAPQVSLETRTPAREDDYTGEPCDESSAESRASIEDGWPVPLTSEAPDAAWVVAMAHLRELASTDTHVLALLGAYDQGTFLKRDVLAFLGWSSRTYKNAYQRLLQLADVADPTVRASITYALTN